MNRIFRFKPLFLVMVIFLNIMLVAGMSLLAVQNANADELPPDTEAPTAPANLIYTEKTSTTINIAWDASIDNVAVTGYEVYMDQALVETTTGTSYTFIDLSPQTEYSFYY